MNARPHQRFSRHRPCTNRLPNACARESFAHELPPGGWIDEQALALEYGISRTPLREALKVLAAEGLVVLKPRRGCYVTQLSEQDIDEVFPVMAVLEGKVAEEAARRITSADFSRLAAIHEELEQQAAANNADRFFEANQRFHSALQEIAGNRYLAQLIDDARKVIKLTRRDSLRLDGRLKQSLDGAPRQSSTPCAPRIRLWPGNACTTICCPVAPRWRDWRRQTDPAADRHRLTMILDIEAD